MAEERLIELETKILQQDLLLEELHQVLYRQQKQIDQLEVLLEGLAKRYKEAASGDQEIGPANERPPHY